MLFRSGAYVENILSGAFLGLCFSRANGFHSRFRQKIKLVLNATRLHARNLSTFAIVYKASMIVLRNLNPAGRGKEGRYDSFFAGLLGGYAVFGRQPGSVSQQVCISGGNEEMENPLT